MAAPTALASPAAAALARADRSVTKAGQDAQSKANEAAEEKADREAQQKANEEADRRAAELKDSQQQFDQLTSRAAAISDGLDTMRRAQAAQGYGLRGDIATAEQLMKTDLARAQEALQQQDGAKAKEFLDKAEVQASIIERFQGRSELRRASPRMVLAADPRKVLDGSNVAKHVCPFATHWARA